MKTEVKPGKIFDFVVFATKNTHIKKKLACQRRIVQVAIVGYTVLPKTGGTFLLYSARVSFEVAVCVGN
jgi:hypothetical protein